MTPTIPDQVELHGYSRDPSGFMFSLNGLYYRQVNQTYAADYDLLMSSGLYRELTEKNLLVPHEEVTVSAAGAPDRYKTLLPKQLPSISYPYEWSPSQLRDAGLLTIKVIQIAMEKGMILKDATPFNIQFLHGKPLFIDTLSFERYDPSRPWVAYRQFCECFLFPLYLQHYLRTGVHRLIMSYPEGIPAALTARMLPGKSRWNMGVWMHVILQAKIRRNSLSGGRQPSFSRTRMQHLLDNLQNILGKLATGIPAEKGWSDYYEETITGHAYLENKEKCFLAFIDGLAVTSALDLGANEGYFTRLLARKKIRVVAIDEDWQCIEALYRSGQRSSEDDILPLCIDLGNPSPGGGFANGERRGFTERAQAELVAALAIIHHLVLARNIPMAAVAGYFAQLTKQYLIIEFVPLSDEKAQLLVRNKDRYQRDYDVKGFEYWFTQYFVIEKKQMIAGTDRVLYLMKKTAP